MPDSRGPDDETSFVAELTALLEHAHTNGTDVEGAWKCSIDGDGDGDGRRHWDVQITEVRYEAEE